MQPVLVLHKLVQIAVLEQSCLLQCFYLVVLGFFFGDLSCARVESMSLSLITHSSLPTPKRREEGALRKADEAEKHHFCFT